MVQYAYDAWGKILSITGAMASSLGALNPFRYRGYVYDDETGLYYLRSRYYNPRWGRFISADSLITKNLFTYCSNSPIVNKDPSGMYNSGIYSEDGEEEIFLSEESYHFFLHQQALIRSRHETLIKKIEVHSNSAKQKLSSGRYITVSGLFSNFDTFIKKRTNFRTPGDSGCAMFIRAGILNKAGPHSDSSYYAGATSMFNKGNLVISGNIADIGGSDNLIKGMILGTKMKNAPDDGLYHVEHVGVYAGSVDLGNGEVHAVYSFNTDTNRGNLSPFSSNSWLYYGWHMGIIVDP